MDHIIRKSFIRYMAIAMALCAVVAAIMGAASVLVNRSDVMTDLQIIRDNLHSMPDSVDVIYGTSVEKQLERVLDSSQTISYAYSTKDWPASGTCVSRVRDDLAAMCVSSSYVSTAFLYNVSDDTYASSLSRFNAATDAERDDYFRDVIYAYNSGKTVRQMIAFSGHQTFMFSYEGTLFLTKEILGRSGQAICILFAELDRDSFSTAVASASRSGAPLSVSVYDQYFNLLFDVGPAQPEPSMAELAGLEENSSGVGRSGGLYRLYYTSRTLPWRYVVTLDSGYVSSIRNTSHLQLLLAAVLALAVVGAAAAAMYTRFRAPLRVLLRNLGVDGRDHQPLLSAVRESSTRMAEENRLLRDVVEHTSEDVVKSMFMGLIMGQQYDPRDISRTLSYTNLGFQSNDVYAVGVAKCGPGVTTEQRFQILNVMGGAFAVFRRKNQCHTFTCSSDTSKFAIIVSYPQERSIAEGKVMTTELSRILSEHLQSTGIPMTLHFGHLYHSILDIGFSYSEADRATDARLGTVSPVILESAPNQEPENDSEQMTRRAAQIARLVYDRKDDEASALTRRVVSGIFDSDSYERQCGEVKYFISALIENIVSYDFISHSQLPDVTSELYAAIEDNSSPEALESLLYDTAVKVCGDFSSILKKQRNPYIKAALDYISQHYADSDLSLNEIADALGVAPNYLSNLFSKNTGMKLFDYITDFRVKKALELLRTTDETVNTISLKSGFSTPRNFIRVFKKAMDTTPGAYRKQTVGLV